MPKQPFTGSFAVCLGDLLLANRKLQDPVLNIDLDGDQNKATQYLSRNLSSAFLREAAAYAIYGQGHSVANGAAGAE